MKLNLYLKIFVLVLCMPGSLSLLNAQSRYKHLPRVKVDKEYNQSHTGKKKTKPEIPVVVTAPVIHTNTVDEKSPDEANVASTENTSVELKSTIPEIKIPAKKQSVKTSKKLFNIENFTEHLKNKSELYKLKNIDKTNANVPLILMIVFYVLGAILIVLALLMLYGLFPGVGLTGFLVVLILGVLFSVAASVLLTLIKLGVL